MKTFFGLSKDKKIVFTYVSPINSCYTKSRVSNILEKIETQFLGQENNFIIMGDLNGKTNLGDDFVRDDLDKHSPINVTSYKKDTYIGRKNMDNHPIDTQGKIILNLCKYLSLRILNRMTEGDPFGQFTRYHSNLRDMPSAIDYALCSESIRQDIISYNVHHLSPISDHCCIFIKIKTNYMTRKPSQSPNENDKIGIENNLCKLKYTYDKNIYTYRLYLVIRSLTSLTAF